MKDYKDKQMKSDEVETKTGPDGEDFFFPGGVEYKPKSIRAKSFVEASEIWEKTKEVV